MNRPRLTRRQAILTAACLPAAAAFAPAAFAAAEMKGTAIAPFNRFVLGGFEVTTLLAGTRTVENPTQIFGLNADLAEFATISEAHFLAIDRWQFFFTPTLVNTGSELVLFDTGLSAAGTSAALAAAGYTPGQIDTVVITHMHGDHIGGLMNNGAPTFANARYLTGSVEFDHWDAASNDGFEANVRPLSDRFAFLADGGSVASGITGMAAFGHTPGQMAYMLESNGQSLVVVADTTNHPVWSLARPDWEVRFDMDKSAAAATRRRILGMLATDRIPFIGYHMPFPAVGFVAAEGDGFRYVPGHAQMMTNSMG